MKRQVPILIATFILLFFSVSSYSQTSISGVINSYSVIDSIYPTNDTVEVATPSLFSAGDTVMVYQAKGAETYTDESNNWELLGTVRNTSRLGSAGKYEIILVKEKIGSQLVLKAQLDNNYDTDGLVQLIKIPSYDNAVVNGELSCDPWDGAKGGVLALLVSDTLTLNANINVSGKGFRGADGVLSNGDCASSDSAGFQKYFFPETFTEAGRKGEGIALHPTDTTHKGISPWANGGGGGNSRFAGGGGGGNYFNGGWGGFEDTISCEKLNYLDETGTVPWEGLNGRSGQGLSSYIDNKTIFFGGGGGSGTRTASLTASTGGDGGGIVIIMAKFVRGNNFDIISNGEDVNTVSTGSGAGGGAGGVIVFDVDSVNGDLTLSVTGGKGGSTSGTSVGPGGGGSGGLILNRNSSVTANVTLDLSPGLAGVLNDLLPVEDTYGATDGNAGSIRNNNKIPLTGFLFNSVINNQQICKDDTPEMLIGSNPRGGDGTFVYQWQHRTNSASWSDISGAINKDFQPPALSDTTYYRRVVTSAGIDDTSYTVKVDVHSYIVNNLIFGDDVITCIGNEADTVTGTKVVLGGDNVSYTYKWQYSIDSLVWNNQAPLNDTTYLHGIITDTTFIRRVVVSGACYDTTSNPVKIIGLPQISDNTLSDDQEICYGQVPEEITGAIPQNGDGSYTILWEQRTTSTSWTEITDSTRYNLAPPNLLETTYYRRIVQSDDCIDMSDSVTIHVLPLIYNDSIVTQSPIYTCYNTPPGLIDGSKPAGGDETFTYQWQMSSDGIVWNNIVNDAANEDYQPVALTNKTYYRRLVSSGENGCCTNITDTIEVDIYSLPVASINDVVDTICSGESISLNFSFSSGKQPYTLAYNDGDADFSAGSIDNTVYVQDLNPVASVESKVYNYTIASVVDDNGCEATDITGESIITVYGWPTSNAGSDDENCLLTYQLSATPSLGTGIWSQVAGSGTTLFENAALANTQISANLAGNYEYKWKETNWHCTDSANVKISLYESPKDVDAGNDTSLFFTDEYVLKGRYDSPDTLKDIVTLWEMLSGTGDIESPNDTVSNLTNLFDAANTGILIKWTVSKGVCSDLADTVKITLKEIFTPTGFTPNGDGVNDYLVFNGLENANDNLLIIFNRWGAEVYRKPNFSNEPGWDGKNGDGNELPEDTYFYILKVTDKEGKSETHKGFIVIKRY